MIPMKHRNLRPIATPLALLALTGLWACSDERSASAPPPTDWSGPAHTAAPPPTSPHAAASDSIRVAEMTFPIPQGWSARAPSNSMRLAELQVPDASGSEDLNCVAAFSLAGGDIESNIARWIGQFTNATPATRDRRTVSGRTVYLVEISGDYHGMGMGPSLSNQMMRAAIVERPGQQNLFIKMTGPRDRMAAIAEGWDALVNGMQ